MNSKSHFQTAANRAENGGQVIHARIAFGREHAMQALTGSFGHFCKLLETKRCIHKVSKNNARRFRFVTEKQSCGLIQECFGESRISLDPSHYGFLEITSERHVNYLLRFSALLAAALGALRDLYSVCNTTARSISACCRRFVPPPNKTMRVSPSLAR